MKNKSNIQTSTRLRTVLFDGGVEGSDGTGGVAENNGFLTITLRGEDKSWTYVNAKISASQNLVGEVTWAYSNQMDFSKTASLTVPILKGEGFRVDWTEQRNAGNIKARVVWTPQQRVTV